MKEKTLRFLIYLGVFAVVCVIFALAILSFVQIFKINKLKKEQQNLQTQLNALLEDTKSYESAIAYVESEQFIEDFSRDGYLGRSGDEFYGA